MKKIISVPLSIIHYAIFGGLLCLFHPIQWIAIHCFGRNSHRKIVEFLNKILIISLNITGNSVKFSFKSEIPKNAPILFVANHQSVYDIPPLIWFLREFDPKFVGKKELDNGTPSIGINLKHNGSVLIDRKNPKEAVEKLKNFGKFLKENNFSGLIFPEGTRSRNGQLKPFKTKGVEAIISEIPHGYIVPITINNSWKILRYGVFPLGLGSKPNFIAHSPIAIEGKTAETILEEARKVIEKSLN